MENHFFSKETQAVQVNADGSSTEFGGVYFDGDLSDDHVRHDLASITGYPVEDIQVRTPGKESGSGRAFGFSNWSGASWEPSGPKANWKVPEHPELN